VTNPAARNDPTSEIYGMPILNVDQARTAVILKRSMNPGFAGIENPLFYAPKSMMLFGDARASILKLIAAVKEVEGAPVLTNKAQEARKTDSREPVGVQSS
jgi:NAD(P) transhydrogenase subunit beta